MKYFYLFCLSILYFGLFISEANATVFMVNSQNSFDNAHNNATSNDSIIWESGTYADIFMEIDKNRLFIGAEVLGETVFNGESRARIYGDFITFQGFQYVGGNIGTEHVIRIYGSNNHINELNIKDYNCYKYLIIQDESQYVRVTYSNFEHRINMEDQNIFSILVNENQPGFHKVQYCSFKNFPGGGNDEGVEPIRIGVSTQAEWNSRSLVEYCYFTQCDGDGEIISNKSGQNVFRFNTFENNPKAELVLRHGSEGMVYGNFFLNGKGGVRVREGQNHYIYNNYFGDLNDRSIYLQNEDSDPLANINIAFNTIVDCSEVRLGGDGNDKPSNVTFANNIFTDPKDELFEDRTGTETWISNIAFGDLGIFPADGLTQIDPMLLVNEEGYFGLNENSPAIDAAEAGYLELPQFEGMDPIDTNMMFDLMGQERPETISEKDIGCNEYPHNTIIMPFATEENTGPSYNSSQLTGITTIKIEKSNLFQFYPNPIKEQMLITLFRKHSGLVYIEVYDVLANKITTLFKEKFSITPDSISCEMGDLRLGVYFVKVSILDEDKNTFKTQNKMFVKL